MITARRVARKWHWCSCENPIQPGHVYLMHTSFPSDEFPASEDHPVRLPECATCAARYGRDYLLGNIPEGQSGGYWFALMKEGLL